MPPTPPFDYTNLDEILGNDNTRNVSIKEWEKFIEHSKITSESGFGKNSKSEEILLSYLKHRRTDGNGVTGNSLRVFLSRISALILHFYRFQVSKVRYFEFQKINVFSQTAMLYSQTQQVN